MVSESLVYSACDFLKTEKHSRDVSHSAETWKGFSQKIGKHCRKGGISRVDLWDKGTDLNVHYVLYSASILLPNVLINKYRHFLA